MLHQLIESAENEQRHRLNYSLLEILKVILGQFQNANSATDSSSVELANVIKVLPAHRSRPGSPC